MIEWSSSKMARLPVWVRVLLKQLETQADPNNNELRLAHQRVVNAEERCRRMQDRMNAMMELMSCAGRGGHETAQAYVDKVISSYTSDTE